MECKSQKAMSRKRHRPQRTCVGCGQVEDKDNLIRIVRSPGGVYVDVTGKRSGRGAYLHPRMECWQKGMGSSLAHALRTTLTEGDRERLRAYTAEHLEEGAEE